MNSSRQTTLFHSWGKSDDTSVPQDNPGDIPADDDILLAACQEWESETSGAQPACSTKKPIPEVTLFRTNQQGARSDSHQNPPLPPMGTLLEDLPGFDVTAGDIWIYPINYSVRDYQFNIVQQALFKNTMVTLPTGLGKTFIAAVVMYNFYRWYPQGKIVFMAPTKPLVAQQIEACYNIMGIPQGHMAEMTGNMFPVERKRCWFQKRVFFLTPQVLMNDLSRRACPAEDIKCLIVDEAHKALGNHAYCQVVKELSKYTQQFRILALSATPGGDLKAVQAVLRNLLVSHIEIRSEDCIDIKQYVHERKVEKVVVPLGEELKRIRDIYLQIIVVYTQRLQRCGALYKKDPTSLTKYEILRSRDAFRQDPPQHVTSTGAVEGDFALCISLYHGYELLLQHGLRSLFYFLQSSVDSTKGWSRTKQELLRNRHFCNLMEILRDKFDKDNIKLNGSHADLNSSRLFLSPVRRSQNAPSQPGPFIMSHPKMIKLQDIVVDHFKNFVISVKPDENKPTSTSRATDQTRVMIFAQYRDSVHEISEMLNRHQPLIRCMSFIGQASAGKNTKGFTQKEQLRVVKEFREGGYNTVVSTCVGEEGLDIGDVDLIVCYDAHQSPIRLVQRMGRTGRKRQGRIVMLVTEGKEAAVYDRSQYKKKSIHKALQGNARSLELYTNNPRMVPRGLAPVPHKMYITVAEYKTNQKDKRGTGNGMKQNQGTIMNYVKPSKPEDRCFLTSDELAQWSEFYQIPAPEVDTVPKIPDGGHFVTLKGRTKTQSKKPVLSLNQWSLWQNKHQPTVKICHSIRTKNFVELMQFIELQGHIDDDDPYGLEMQMYLDEEDIIKPAKRKDETEMGIRRFCKRVDDQQRTRSPSQDSGSDNAITLQEVKTTTAACQGIINTDMKDEDGNVKKRTVKNKKRRIVVFSEDEPISSNNDLPAVNVQDKDEAPRSPVFDQGNMISKETAKEKHSEGKKGTALSKEAEKKRKNKKKRPKSKVIDSSDDDDFEVNLRNKNKKSPAQKIMSMLEKQNGHVNQEPVSIGNVAVSVINKEFIEVDSPEPMDTAYDTQASSQEEASLSHTKSDNHHTSNISLGMNMDGSKLSLIGDLSNVFPNCSQMVRSSGQEQIEDIWTKNIIPPLPPSISSLDVLDDMNLSLNTTPGLDLFVDALVLSKKVTSNPKFYSNKDNPPKMKTDQIKTQPEQQPETVFPDINKFHHIDNNSFTGSATRSDKLIIPSEFNTDIDDKQQEFLSPNRGKDFEMNYDKNSDSNFKCKLSLPKQIPMKNETIAIDKTNNLITKGRVEETDVSFTLGDFVFSDCQSFGEISDKEDKPDLGESSNRMEGLKHFPEALVGEGEVTFDPIPFEFPTPKMCNRTILGLQDTSINVSKNLVISTVDINYQESFTSIQSGYKEIFKQVGKKCEPNAYIVNNLDQNFSNAGTTSSNTGVKLLSIKTESVNIHTGVQTTSVADRVTCGMASVKADGSTSRLRSKDTQSDLSIVKNPEIMKDSNLSLSQSSSKASSSEVVKDDLLIPQFDLGFDLDPQFDLDFDLDNLDESDLEAMDIVPPSPTAIRQYDYISQVPRNSYSHTSSRTFSTPTMLQFQNEKRPDRPSSSTPMQGKMSMNNFSAIENYSVSPILSHSTTKKVGNPSNPTASVSNETPAFSVDDGDLQIMSAVHAEKADLPTPSTLCSLHTIFKPIRSLSNKVNLDSSVGKRKSSSPLAPSGMLVNAAKRRKSGPKINCGESEISRPVHVNPVPETSGVEQSSFIDLEELAEEKDVNEDDLAALKNTIHLTPVSEVTAAKKDDTTSVDDEDFIPFFRKKKKSTTLQSLATSTFKTPGKPPRKLSRPSNDSKRLLTTEVLEENTVQTSGIKLLSSPLKRNSTLKLSSLPMEKPLDEDTDSDEDIVPGGRRRKVRVLDSPLSQVVKSPQDLAQGVQSRLEMPTDATSTTLTTSSDDEFDMKPSFIRPAKTLPKPMASRCLTRKDDHCAGGQFTKVLQRQTAKQSSSSSDEIGKAQRHKMKAKKKGLHRARNSEFVQGFLDEDVEVSDAEDYSSDESGSDLDNSLDGFINYATQLSQQSQAVVNQSDMHAIYMKSIRSPKMNNRFKMVRNSNRDNIDVFSQMPVQDESYCENSFVVHGGEDEAEHCELMNVHVEDESLLENTINVNNIVSGSRRRLQIGMSKAERILKRGRRKILSSSSSDEDVSEIHNNRVKRTRGECQHTLGSRKTIMIETVQPKDILVKSKTFLPEKRSYKHKIEKDEGVNQNLNNTKPYEMLSTSSSKMSTLSGRTALSTNLSLINLSYEDNVPRVSITRSSSSSDTNDNDTVNRLTLVEQQKAERLQRQREQQRLFRLKIDEKKKTERCIKTTTTVTHNAPHLPIVQQGMNTAISLACTSDDSQSGQQPNSPSITSTNEQCNIINTGNVVSAEALHRNHGCFHRESVEKSAKVLGTGQQVTDSKKPDQKTPISRVDGISAPLTSPLKGSQKKPIVLIDSKELASSSHIVSTLMLQYNLNAIVCQLTGCDFIVSSRMGVEKTTWTSTLQMASLDVESFLNIPLKKKKPCPCLQLRYLRYGNKLCSIPDRPRTSYITSRSIKKDFANSANKTKLVDRMRHLCELFDRPCLIIEKDRVKPRDDKKPKTLVRTKFVDSMLANLAMTHIKVFFSESVEDTARILSELALAEGAKGTGIASVPDMDQHTLQVFKFYQSIPRVSYLLALSLLLNFSSVEEVITSSISQLQRKANISQLRAADLHQVLRHKFDEQMTGGASR